MPIKISKTVALSVWLIASFFYAYQYILRVMPNLILNELIQQFHIDAAIFGQFSGVYYIGYSLMHIPLGLMLDRYGPKKVMTACVLLTVIGVTPIIFAEHWIYPVLGRALIGMGSSAAILGSFKIIRMVFNEKAFTRMLSLSVTIGLIGAIYGGGPVSYMCAKLGYKMVVDIFACLGLFLALVTYLVVPALETDSHGNITSDIKEVFINPKVIALCCCAGCMVGPLEGFADVWGSAFLKQVYGFDPAVASYLPSMIFIGMCFGAPVLSLIAEKTGYYIGSIIGAGILMLIIFLALVAQILTQTSITIGFLMIGVCCAYQILAIYKASTYVPAHAAGLTTAVANMIIMSFGYAFHTIIGIVVNTYGGTASIPSFIYGISVVPAGLSIGVIGLILLTCQEKGIFN